jgi:hypothetical protein
MKTSLRLFSILLLLTASAWSEPPTGTSTAEYQAADTALNQLYKILKGRMSGSNRAALTQEERDWIRWRDDTCRQPESNGVKVPDCLLRLTEERTEVLQTKLDDGERADRELAKTDPACHVNAESLTRLSRTDLPDPLKEFVPFLGPNERLLTVACVTVEERAGVQYLMASKAPGQIGTVSILTRQRDNELHLDTVNHTVIQIAGEEGSGAGGRFEAISPTPQVFSILNAAGNRCDLYEYDFQFRYSPATSTWLLDTVSSLHVTFDPADEDGRAEQRTTTQTAKDFGKVSFSQFDGTKYGIVRSSKSRIDAVNATPGKCV